MLLYNKYNSISEQHDLIHVAEKQCGYTNKKLNELPLWRFENIVVKRGRFEIKIEYVETIFFRLKEISVILRLLSLQKNNMVVFS